MKRTRFLTAIVGAAVLALGCQSNARNEARRNETGTTVGTSGQTPRTPGDVQRFVEKAAYANNAEIQLGQLAQQKAQSPEVKKFAERMVRDHTAANEELKRSVGGLGIQLPAGLDDDHRDKLDDLTKKSGADFDRDYMKAMVDGHKDLRDALNDRANRVRTTAANETRTAPGGTTGATGTSGTAAAREQAEQAIDRWASMTLPTVEQHLTMAQQIEQTVER